MINELDRFYWEEQYDKAKKMIEKLLLEDPDNHWLLTRLSSVLYEQKKYEEALAASEKALQIAPDCPLVLWDYAGVLRMLSHSDKAVKIYKSILARGVEDVAFGDCGEGLRWAKSLLNDCRYHLAIILLEVGDNKNALFYIQEHLKNRRRGQYSCFSRNKALRISSQIKESRS